MNIGHPARQRGETNTRVLIGIAAVVVAIIAIVAVFMMRPKPEPIPEPGRPLETVEPAQSAEERGDSARDIIARLEDTPGDPDFAEAHARAQDYLAEGRSADAQLLYFYAARGGYAPAAFDLATFNDPNHAEMASGLVATPDPFQAYRWYTAARAAGDERALTRLEELRAWAESASSSGDGEAEQLLLQWEQIP
jgi:TPR repeat protein